jgi:hypothetical protein
MAGRRGRNWRRVIFKVQRIVLSSVCSQPSWCLGPRFRGALYLRSRRSSNPSSFAFCRTSSSSLQRKLAVSAKDAQGNEVRIERTFSAGEQTRP